MQQARTRQVQFTDANIAKCQCLECPVQGGSQCATDKMQQMQSAQGGASGLAPQDVPKVYCSHGEASCGDLDFSMNCICPTCQVWSENDLHAYKYCRDGDATTIG